MYTRTGHSGSLLFATRFSKSRKPCMMDVKKLETNP